MYYQSIRNLNEETWTTVRYMGVNGDQHSGVLLWLSTMALGTMVL